MAFRYAIGRSFHGERVRWRLRCPDFGGHRATEREHRRHHLQPAEPGAGDDVLSSARGGVRDSEADHQGATGGDASAVLGTAGGHHETHSAASQKQRRRDQEKAALSAEELERDYRGRDAEPDLHGVVQGY